MAESTTSINWDDDDDQQWEICNDNGFVYKRRRRRHHHHQQPSPPPPNPEAETRRSRKKKALLALKLKYQQELHQWRHLTSNLGPTTTNPQPSSPPPSSPPPPPLLPPTSTDIDELLLQVEAQESIMGKLSDLCDCVESLCNAAEERAAEALAELPVWGSPRRLVASLTSLFTSS